MPLPLSHPDADEVVLVVGRDPTDPSWWLYAVEQAGDGPSLKHTLDKLPLPSPVYETRAEFETNLCKIFKHCIDIRYNQVPETDYDFWCVAFKDKDGKDVFRKDADKAEITRMLNDPDKYCKLWREYDADDMPASWLVWPHSASKGWCDVITGNIGHRVS